LFRVLFVGFEFGVVSDADELVQQSVRDYYGVFFGVEDGVVCC
jgi:hypothetical protein